MCPSVPFAPSRGRGRRRTTLTSASGRLLGCASLSFPETAASSRLKNHLRLLRSAVLSEQCVSVLCRSRRISARRSTPCSSSAPAPKGQRLGRRALALGCRVACVLLRLPALFLPCPTAKTRRLRRQLCLPCFCSPALAPQRLEKGAKRRKKAAGPASPGAGGGAGGDAAAGGGRFTRNEQLSVFHALGKILYNKRHAEEAAPAEAAASAAQRGGSGGSRGVVLLPHLRRPRPENDAEAVLARAGLSAASVVGFLHGALRPCAPNDSFQRTFRGALTRASCSGPSHFTALQMSKDAAV